MEKQVAKLKKQVKKLKETIAEMKYQNDKRALSETLDLDYYLIRRMDSYIFSRFEEAIKESHYLTAIDTLYGLTKVDKLMKEGVTFENIIRALDEIYLQSVGMREPAPVEEAAEEELPVEEVEEAVEELPF